MGDRELKDAKHKKLKESNYPKAVIENISARLQKKVQDGDIIFQEYVESLGGSIHYVHEKDERRNTMEINAIEDFKIYLSESSGIVENRFIVAHELGHYFLHYYFQIDNENDEFSTVANMSGDSLLEKEASYFAGTFLMPKEQVEFIVNNSAKEKNDVGKARIISAKTSVSLDKAINRLSELKII